ncbi:MAG: hypothetical protein RL336_1049 [Pseudomonadota bacterium]|jgi:HD-GYP domain-containing protein (c-di-GMP phosphodiesterase class II)
MSVFGAMGLRDRLVMIILIVGIGGELATFSYDYAMLDKELLQQGTTSVSRTLYRNSGVIEIFLDNKSSNEVQWLLETLSIQEENVYSAVIDPQGKVIASTRRRDVGREGSALVARVGQPLTAAMNGAVESITWQFGGGVAGTARVCVLSKQALHDKRCYQFIHWEGLQSRRAVQRAEILRGVALQIIFITLLSIGVWFGIGAGVVSRAQAIYDSARRFQLGDLRARSNLKGGDEFAKISQIVDISYDRLAQLVKQIISAFNTATLHSDPFTAGHEDRVADLCRKIGLRMGLTTVRLEALTVAAQVHDIGQSEVPTEIMLSPKHLSPEEFAFIKQHPIVGADILDKIDFPWHIGEIVLHHHENYDGSGYPDGLFGEDICLESRIIRVADVFESLVSHRPHRDAMDIEQAKAFMQEFSERYFDPEIVSHLMAILEEGYTLPEVLHIKNPKERPDFVSGALLYMDDQRSGLALSVDNVGIEHGEHYAEALQAVERSIEAIAKTLEHRDPYTTGHQERVAAISVMIGREMGMSSFDLEGLRMAAVVHDIGKIKIPISILTKPRRLNKVEYDLIRTHPTASYDILKGLEMPWPVAEIAYQHHEAWDGSGYPRGLKGDKILLQARILSVADIVESMSASRPYRPALGLDQAIKEVNALSGSKLDPAVVEAFMACTQSLHWQKLQDQA